MMGYVVFVVVVLSCSVGYLAYFTAAICVIVIIDIASTIGLLIFVILLLKYIQLNSIISAICHHIIIIIFHTLIIITMNITIIAIAAYYIFG
jgi:hypothetical protein